MDLGKSSVPKARSIFGAGKGLSTVEGKTRLQVPALGVGLYELEWWELQERIDCAHRKQASAVPAGPGTRLCPTWWSLSLGVSQTLTE